MSKIINHKSSIIDQDKPIDRQAVVRRHQPVLRRFDAESPLSVGNGEFAFTVDATGLQTFPGAFEKTIPLCTMSQWGWHSFPNPRNYHIDAFAGRMFNFRGREVRYIDADRDQPTDEVRYLRENPHRLHLGNIGLALTHTDGRPAAPDDLADIRQTLDLWSGRIDSAFTFAGKPVRVQTVCHPDMDLIAVRVESELSVAGRLGVELRFPYGSPGITAADWSLPEAHTTEAVPVSREAAQFARKLDDDSYHVTARWSTGATMKQTDAHGFRITPSGPTLEVVIAFVRDNPPDVLPSFEQTIRAAAQHGQRFWSSGGVIDLSGSGDPRWEELERRIVLSQYLTAIQCAGSFPPQETGLTCNSWYGKFHLEMHWWHAVHFALWNRIEMLEKSLGWYESILPRAREAARRQGYSGARWPKMTDPSGRDSPSPIGPFLVWQQPHSIYYAELCRRPRKDHRTLERFKNVVFETAEFMASYAADGSLGPILQCAQEIFPRDNTLNPTFELTCWRWGLETAQQWRQHLGSSREPKWDDVLKRLPRPTVVDGKYAFAQTTPDCYDDSKWRNDHPSVLAAIGMLPGPGIDAEVMRRTLRWVWENWNWESTWGWDYPMIAMCAARLGETQIAIDALLLDTPKNRYALNGHNFQREGLPLYLPGNGGLLTAAAMMAAGWDGAPQRHAPGFPDDGSWRVKCENLRSMP